MDYRAAEKGTIEQDSLQLEERRRAGKVDGDDRGRQWSGLLEPDRAPNTDCLEY